MRSLIVFATLCVVAANAFVDFPAMSPEPKRSIHPTTGNVHYELAVDHAFPESNTFFKAKYEAEHEAHWHIIQLHEHVDEMTKDVHCGIGEKGEIDHLVIPKPSAQLLEQVHRQKASNYAHTVITAKGKHHCKGKGIFRQLTAVVENPVDGAITLICKGTSYNKIFKNLHLRIDTNHVHQKMDQPLLPEPPVQAEIENPYAANPNHFQSKKRLPFQREMSTQHWGHHHHHFFRHVAHACKHAVHRIAHACKHAVKAVGNEAKKIGHDASKVVKKVVDAVSDFSVDHTFTLPGLNFNKDVSKHFTAYNAITGDYKVAASFSFQPTVTFVLDIHHFKLENLEAYFTGVTKAGVTGSFDSTVNKEYKDRVLVTTIHIDQITFSIGPVPVWLDPSVPIYAGFDLSIDGDMSVQAVLSAHSTIQFGFAYSDKTGFRTIKEQSWTFTHDFGPLEYKADVGLNMYVEPMLALSIESVGDVAVGISIFGDIEVESNSNCAFSLDLKVNPIISLNAGIDIELLHHSIYKKTFGPWTLFSKVIPIKSYCKPWSAKAHKAIVDPHDGTQSDSKGKLLSNAPASSTSPVAMVREMSLQQAHNHKVITTVDKELGGFNIGKAWSGSGQSLQNGHTIKMDLGAQFTATEVANQTLVYITVSKSMIPPGMPSSYTGLLTAVAVMAYTCPEFPAAGKVMTLTLDPTSNNTYHFAGNSTVLDIVPSPTVTWTLDSEDVRFVSMDSNMTYGTVALMGPQANNDSSSFNVFEQGYGTPDVMGMDKTDVLVVLVYAGVATVLLIVAIILAVVFFKKFRTVESTEALRAKDGTVVALNSNEETVLIPSAT